MELVSLDQPLNGKATCQLACRGYSRLLSIRSALCADDLCGPWERLGSN